MKNKDGKKGPALPVLSSLKDILAVVQAPVAVRFKLDDRECELHVTRALSAVMEQRRALLRAVQPPFVKEWNRYDDLNAGYLAKRDLSILQARSLTVYLCCPEVAAQRPGLTDAGAIHQAIGNLLPEALLELIELTALAGGLDTEVSSRSNFTFPPPSES